ncbi:L-histidine N(alpha)-methyltransferase [Reichenbachiella carrageenanivorans]|uniref:L-histidine N(Alpha)-methyltransferase n=1 Tax=Reichenbachiella carrageenanivorans TaxID=2979869 RepID=A0ABY6D292_9BACT|nr:L-histidine N(alpha)-methyltransferase [Reichenbachiella carrageenanivorans]UXX77960.1 L-histidine N(alpha)-methyltransferase [Reichenbachiella carrageenanivorans]
MFETIEKDIIKNKQFLTDVHKGLSDEPKHLSSKYFYDKKGDELFQQIMHMEEYYLTNAELDIFQTHKCEIAQLFAPNKEPFNLIEFGAGDGMKTKVLLKELLDHEIPFDYVPIDISQNALDQLNQSLTKEMPALSFKGIQGDYFEVLNLLKEGNNKRNVVLFLGSNIGNFTNEEALSFTSEISDKLNTGDLLLIGVDLKKEPRKILLAYNDPAGITASFNYNLLHRINRELGANFDVAQFEHHATYDPVTGECKSALLSKIEQDVTIEKNTFHFAKWEPIHTEISRKYALKQLHQLAKKSGFIIKKDLFDTHRYFVDSIWEIKK